MRLFVGVAPDVQARRVLLESARAMETQMPGKYGKNPQMFHVTLAFIGETDPQALESVREALKRCTKGMKPFSLTLGQLGFFGKREHAIVFGGLEASDALWNLACRVRETLEQSEIPFDPKPFRAHITLARQVKLKGDWQEFAPTPVSFPVRFITLYHSTRIDGVLRYLPIGEFPLEP